MILSLNNPLPSAAAYPDLTESNPKKKSKAYIMQFGQAFVSQYLASGSQDFYLGRSSGRYKLAEDYANGRQQVKAILKDEEGHRDTSGSKVDLMKPLKLLKKSLRAVDGKLKDHDFVATVTPIDATAQDEKRDYESRLRMQMEHGAFLQSLGIGAAGPAAGGGQPQPQGPEVPLDEDELALYMEVKYRHRDAMLLEMKLALALYKSDYVQINRQCLRDETTYGSSAIYLGLRGATRLPARLNPGYCLFLPSDTESYTNLQAGAHIEKISLAHLLKEIDADPDTTLSAGELDQLESLARQSLGKGSYTYSEALTGKPEMAGQLEVLRFSFKSYDEVVQKEYTNKFGNRTIRDKPAGYEEAPNATKGKVHRQKIASWYEGTLILNTEIGYGCRKAYEQLRDEDNPFDCHPLYVVTSPDMLGGFTESIVEQSMTLVDTACEAFTRLRFKLATMIGSWMEFDIDAIEAGALTKGNGAKMSAQETIAHFFRNGYIAARKGNPDDPGGRVAKIVEAGELPFAQEIATHWNTIAQCRQEIEAITGINGSISAEDPASRQGVGVTQMAIAGAENTLEYLYRAKQSRFERVTRALAVSLKQSEARQPLTGALPTSGGVEIVGTSDTLAGRVMLCKVERLPTDTEWNDFYETAKVALNQKEITLGDYSFLRQISNLKQATVMLGIRAKRNQAQASQSAQEQTSMASQQQQESAKIKGDEDRKTLNVEYDRKIELEALKGRNAVAAAEVQKQGHLDATELLGMYKLQQQQADLGHKATQSQQAAEVEMAQHGASLDSQEQESEAQRAHEAQMAADQRQSEPAAA